MACMLLPYIIHITPLFLQSLTHRKRSLTRLVIHGIVARLVFLSICQDFNIHALHNQFIYTYDIVSFIPYIYGYNKGILTIIMWMVSTWLTWLFGTHSDIKIVLSLCGMCIMYNAHFSLMILLNLVHTEGGFGFVWLNLMKKFCWIKYNFIPEFFPFLKKIPVILIQILAASPKKSEKNRIHL